MSISPDGDGLQRIVVLNPKGGCGKSTIATNLASYFALRGPVPTLIDCDPQGFSTRWLERRARQRPAIHGIAAYKLPITETRAWQLRVPPQTRCLIVDTPAGLEPARIHDLIYGASNLIIPILPSAFDIRFAARFIAELLLYAQLDRGETKVGIVANRTRKNTRSLRKLLRFLSSLGIPLIATLRDSQNYVAAAGRGIGVYELPHHKAKVDIENWSQIVSWLSRQSDSEAMMRESPVAESREWSPRSLH